MKAAVYTFRWSISGHANLGTGRGKSRTIDTGKLDKGEYRQVFTVTDKNGTAYNGSVNFTVLEAVETSATNTGATAEIPTISTADFLSHKPTIIKDKDIITAGDIVTFSLDANYEDARYYWVFDGNGITAQTGAKNTLVVNTVDLPPGRYRLRGTITSKNREQHQLQMNVDIISNWIGIELDTDDDISPYQGDKYELILPDGSIITGEVRDQKIFRINVPANVEYADFRWVD